MMLTLTLLTTQLLLSVQAVVSSSTPSASGIAAFLASLDINPPKVVQWATSAPELSCQLSSLIGPSKTVDMNASSYATLANENWAENARLQPECIFLPSSTTDIAIILKIVAFTKTAWALRGGGHEVERGLSNTQGGLLVDMSNFKDLNYDESMQTVTVGAGLRWEDVYAYLSPFNVTVVGGRVTDVGVAGLVLGSGLSWHSNKHGLVCDNVNSFQVVVANGTVLNVNLESHSDLFWALKGGMNNFGIVTRFTFNTLPQGLVWGGYVGYTLDQASDVIHAFAQYQTIGQLDQGSNLMVQIVPTNVSFGILVTFFYDQGIAWPSAFSPFRNITSVFDTTQVTDFVTLLSSENAANSIAIPRWNWRSTSFKGDYATLQQTYDTAAEVANSTTTFQGKTVVWSFQPVSVNLVKQGQLKGGNALGLSAVSQVWSKTDVGWSNPASDAVAEAISPVLIARVENGTRKSGKHLDYQFMNDASKDQLVLRSYGSENCERLQRVARIYDPESLFQTLPGFKLPTECS